MVTTFITGFSNQQQAAAVLGNISAALQMYYSFNVKQDLIYILISY